MNHQRANGDSASFGSEPYPCGFLNRAPQKHRCPGANPARRIPDKNSIPRLQPTQRVKQPFVVCNLSHHHVEHIAANGAPLQNGALADDLGFFRGTVNQKSGSVWHKRAAYI
jgi:hypothetical protein